MSEEITARYKKFITSFVMVFFPKYDDQITKGETFSICNMFIISSMCICRLNWKSSEDETQARAGGLCVLKTGSEHVDKIQLSQQRIPEW
jgi:hypothetical protein